MILLFVIKRFHFWHIYHFRNRRNYHARNA